MRAPAAMALFKTKEKCRGRARFVAAALQKASVCTPKLGYRTSIAGVLRGSPAGLRRARAFSAMAPPVRLGDFAQGPTRARTLCFPVQKKTRFKPLVRKWYRLVSALPFPHCRLSYLSHQRGGEGALPFTCEPKTTASSHLGRRLLD